MGAMERGYERGLIFCSLTCILLAGCSAASQQVSLSRPTKTYAGDDYGKVFSRWTRDDKILQLKDLDTTLRVHATCFSPDYIAAYVARHEQMFKLPRQERDDLSRELNQRWDKAYHFLVGAATSDFKYNDFDARRSIWRVALVNDKQQQVAPLKLVTDQAITATMRDLFPYIGRFTRVYRISFPRALPDGTPLVREDTRHIALRFAGPLGKTELVWRLR